VNARKDNDGILITHSIKRVKKKINDFILHNYTELFSLAGADTTLSAEDILGNEKLLKKAQDELRLSDEKAKTPR